VYLRRLDPPRIAAATTGNGHSAAVTSTNTANTHNLVSTTSSKELMLSLHACQLDFYATGGFEPSLANYPQKKKMK
jgi:hypothetical protein